MSGGLGTDGLASELRQLAARTLAIAAEVTLVFVTNLRTGDLRDVGPDGIDNSAQYYSRAQADGIIRSLQELGTTVRSYFSEQDFFRAALSGELEDQRRYRVVFTTAEGGTGSGRRALIPAFCNLLGLPVLNSGAHACSLACHKFHANAVLRDAGVNVPHTWMMTSEGWFGGRRPPFGTKVIVKPAYESMSIGVAEDSVRRADEGLDNFVAERRDAFRQDTIVQEFVTGEEIGVPLIRLGRTVALPPVAFRRADGSQYGRRPRTFAAEVLDHDASLAALDVDPVEIAAIQRTAVAAFDALQMRGIARIDMRIDADGRPWVFDTNIAPPPLDGTSFATSVAHLGLGLREMLAVWLGACLVHYGIVAHESSQ